MDTPQNQSSGGKIKITEEEKKIGFELEQLNDIYLPFTILSDLHIARWSKTIVKLKPELTPEILKKLVVDFRLGNLEYDKNIGIVNIFRGLNKVNMKNLGM